MPRAHIRHTLALAAATALAGVLSLPAAASAEMTGPTLTEALAALPVQDESRDGYDRDLFRHWVDEDNDGCNSRAEVLSAEASLHHLSLNTYRRS